MGLYWDRFQEGFDKGHTQGYNSGYAKGYGAGREQGIVESQEFQLGHNRGFSTGLFKGIVVAVSVVTLGLGIFYVWKKQRNYKRHQKKIKQFTEAIAVVRQSPKIHNPLQDDLKKLFLNRSQTDVTVEVKGGRNNDVSSFKSHKIILSIRCPWFASQYHFDPTKNHYVIDLQDNVVPSEWWSTSDFEEVLYFIYTHQIRSHVDGEACVGVLIIAHYLQCNALVMICEIKLGSKLSLDNIHQMFKLGQLLQLKLLIEDCDEFIRTLPAEVKDNTLKELLA